MLTLELDEVDVAVRDEALRFFAGAGAKMLEAGDDARLWTQLHARGWATATIDEAVGGEGGSILDAGLIALAMGSGGLYAGYASHVGACEALRVCGTAEAGNVLRKVVASAAELALLDDTHLPRGRGADGMRAGVVRRNGAEKLFVVDKPADREALSCVDGALSELEQFPGALRDRVQIVSYAPDAEGTTVLASGAQAQAAWAHGMRCARLLACAQTVGAVRRLHAQVVDYARTRKQFGQPIGSFQAVQHKLVNVFFELEAGERLVYRALWALAADDEDTAPVDVAIAFVRGQAWDWLINSYDVYGGTGYIDGIGVNETTRGVLELLTAVGRSNDGYERVYDAIRPGGFLAETADHV